MTQNNVQLFLSVHLKCLKILGIWNPEYPNKLYDIYQLLSLGLQYSIVLFIFIYLGNVWGDLEKMTMGMYVLFTQASTCLKMTAIVVNRKTMVEVLGFMNCETFCAQNEEEMKILLGQFLKMRRLLYFLLIAVTVNIIEWAVFPLADREAPRAYPFTMWMPGNIENSPDFELGYIYQLSFAFLGAYAFMTLDCVAITMISFGCALLDIIKDKLRKIQEVPYTSGLISKERDDIVKENNAILTECLSLHQAIIRFIASVENFFNINIFFQLSGSAIIVCLIAFRLSVEPPNTTQFYATFNYLMTMVAQLYFFCWSGNELTTRSQELRDELYQCPWYEQDASFHKKVCFAMECMKKPIVFKAGHFVTLSRPTFIAILRCSYSYFAVLNQANSQ